MNRIIRKRIYTAISCVIGAAALCAAIPASVQAEDAPSKVVRFHDLDITTADGAKALYSRIRAAARDVCTTSVASDPIMRPAIKGCIDKTVDKAVKDVNAPMLTSVHSGGTDVRLASK